MCGIAGFKGFSNCLEMAHAANLIQFHRGPDAQSVWRSGNVAFAHQRLSIIDLNERSNQPFEKNGFVIVFNGEIYNYRNLRKKLEDMQSTRFYTQSDTEVVLEMYRAHGKDCLQYFEGMFAFAIFCKNTGEIFLARDHFGIKPLFYYHTESSFAFSSELKVLAKVLPIERKINYAALIGSINYVWVPGNESTLEDINKLPPAHYMVIEANGNMSINRYWQVNEMALIDASEEEIIERLDDILTDSITRHMIADVEVGAFLSGGLDSSLITAMASVHNKKLKTFTIGTNEKDKKIEKMPPDERYAKQLAQQFGFEHKEIIIQPNIVDDLPKMIHTLDEPIGDPAALNTFLICKDAYASGIKVLLSGMGADEIYFGYRRQKATFMAQRYKALPEIVRNGISSVVDFLPVKFAGRGIRVARWAKKFTSFANLSVDEAYRMSYSYYTLVQLQGLLSGHHDNEIANIKEMHKEIFYSAFNGEIINQMCNTDINMFMTGLNLTYTDRASMAASTEVRVPFVDKKMIEFAMQVPGHFKYKKGESKYILKRCAEKYLPKNIIYRPKASFGAPIRSWISGDLSEMVGDILSKDSVKERGIFNCHVVQKLIENDKRGIEDNAYRIYQLLTMELWMREFVD